MAAQVIWSLLHLVSFRGWLGDTAASVELPCPASYVYSHYLRLLLSVPFECVDEVPLCVVASTQFCFRMMTPTMFLLHPSGFDRILRQSGGI